MATRKTTPKSKRAAGNDAIAMLKEDHKRVQQLLEKLESSRGRASKARDSVLAKVEQEIKIHTAIEEDIFYPAFKDAARKQEQHLYFEAVEEHHVVDGVLSEMQNGAEPEQFAARSKVLRDLIEHHIREEEREMFPVARKVIGTEGLRDLGEQMKQRKDELSAEAMPAAG